MLSKNHIKHIQRLKLKKHRLSDNLFVAEGVKTINELLQSSFTLEHLYTTKPFVTKTNKQTLITDLELKKISFLTTPNTALAVFKIPKPQPINTNSLIVALDNVRDPGNLGTIIRLCDWFGIPHLICNTETVDCYNPKVIQATMGSITRVNITYLDLDSFLASTTLPVFGAFMDGSNVYKTQLPENGILILGNEANGISTSIKHKITKPIAIPQFGVQQDTESLNVATATAILLSEFKRTTEM